MSETHIESDPAYRSTYTQLNDVAWIAVGILICCLLVAFVEWAV